MEISEVALLCVDSRSHSLNVVETDNLCSLFEIL